MKQVIVRILSGLDASDYRAIRLHGLEHDPVAFGGCHLEESLWSVDDFAALIERDTNTFFGAFDETGMIGCVALTQARAQKLQHKAQLWGMYTLPDAQGRGVGRALMNALLDYARQTTIERIVLAVTMSNRRACQWYANLGFVLYGIEYQAVKFSTGYDHDELRVLELNPAIQSELATSELT